MRRGSGWMLALTMVLIGLCATTCARAQQQPGLRQAQTGQAQTGQVTGAQMKMWDFAVFPSGDEFRLELAISDRERALGYMYREKIGGQEAMLFFFEEPGLHGIWMRNCLVPLDLIWLDLSHQVVHIVHSAPPCARNAECPSHTPMRNANYVLEAAGGTAKRTGLSVGDRIQLIEIDQGNR